MEKKAVILLMVGLIGVAMVLAGVVFIATEFFEKQINKKVEQEVPLKEGSDSFNTWKDPPAPVYMQFYVFDVVDHKDFLAGTGKPKVVQKGPYTYREIRDKGDISFLANDTLLSYRENKTYILDLAKSCGDPRNDTFTSINLFYLSVGALFQNFSNTTKSVVDFAMKEVMNQHIFINKTVSEYIWGYDPPPLVELLKALLKKFGIKLPDKIGLFTGDNGNGTNDGVYNIWTGTSDLDKYNIIDTWNDERSLIWWNDKYCNAINGSDGTGWHPFISKDDILYLFSTDICRSIYIQYDHSRSVKGIPLYQFVPPSSVLADNATNPDNGGFCTPNCLGAGVLNVTNCKGAPLIVSQPHFYQGAAEYIDAIKGLSPSKDKHETFVAVEPLTGASLSVSKKIQLNADLQHYGAISELKDMVNDTIFPILWVDENAEIDDHGANKFKKEVLQPIEITKGVKYGLIALGAFIILIVLVIVVYIYVYKRRQEDGTFLKTPVDGDDDPLVTA